MYNSPGEKYNVKEYIWIRLSINRNGGADFQRCPLSADMACLEKEDMMGTVLKNLKGLLYAFILFILLTLLISVIVKLTPAPEGWALYYMVVVLSVSCLFLGVYIGNYIKKKGFVYGALYSVIFLLILLAFYMLAFSTEVDMGIGMLKFLIPVLAGSIGGMIGVNLKN